jgi:hypothetical protein
MMTNTLNLQKAYKAKVKELIAFRTADAKRWRAGEGDFRTTACADPYHAL